MSFVISKNLKKNENHSYLRKLPTLEFTTKLYPDADLRDVFILCAQHLLPTTYALFYHLLDLGILSNNLSVIGKCYSTDPIAYQEMREIGIDVCPSSFLFRSDQAFDSQYRRNIKNFVLERIERLKYGKFKKIIILDDGGELIQVIQDLSSEYSFLRKPGCVICIEQTSSGFDKLKDKKIVFPIVNVARSPGKLIYESPIIARLLVNAMLDQVKNCPIVPEKILLIGNGVIGSKIKNVLIEMFNVDTFDENPVNSSVSGVDFLSSLKEFDVIIGCTGKTILNAKQYGFLKKNVALISASSSDREFNAVSLRRKLPLVADCHTNLFVDDIFLVNCGFPANFSSNFNETDPDEIQLTRSFLLAAILQANSHSDCAEIGFISLDEEIQREIIKFYHQITLEENHYNKH